MAAPQLTEYLNTVVATTQPHFGSEAFDNLFRGDSVGKLFWEKGAVVGLGGRELREALLYQTALPGSSVKWQASAYDAVGVAGSDPYLQIRDLYRPLAALMTLSDDEIDDNMGPERILDVLKLKRDVASREMLHQLNLAFLATSDVTNGPHCLRGFTPTTPSSYSQHGIDGTTYSWARNIAVTTGGSFAALGEGFLMQAYISACRGMGIDEPNLMLSDGTMFIRWWKRSPARDMYIIKESEGAGSKLGSNSYPSAMKFRNADWVWDVGYADSTTIQMLNTDYLKLYVKNKSMEFQEVKPTAIDQWFAAWRARVRMQMIGLVPSRQAIISGLTD